MTANINMTASKQWQAKKCHNTNNDAMFSQGAEAMPWEDETTS